ncbi:MAG: Rieske 2Fe-2S domain-containing protein [Clostridia bacterium]|nr:Rieske 2Fe-2S domain-containing protein [Clostridia bacterium]
MSFVKVAETPEISAGMKKKVVIGSTEILLSNIDGEFYAVNDKCPHMGGSLSEGILEGHLISCPRHGSKFDVKTGKNMDGAKILFMKMKVHDIQSYETKVDGKDIFVDIGE